jgi:ribosome-associated heat shock protein Hsp15
MTQAPKLRLDKWLVYARFCKSRSSAAELAINRRLRVNSVVVTKPHHKVKPGDVLTFPQATRIRVVRVLDLAERRGPARDAQLLYESLDTAAPPPRGRDTIATVVA